jgi:hypothetical protein
MVSLISMLYMENSTAFFNIDSLEMMEGDLPLRAQRLVKDWASLYQVELLHMWQTNEYKQLPGLE